MPDQHISGLYHVDDRGAPTGQRGILGQSSAMTGKVHCNALVTQTVQLGDGALPAPGSMKTAVDEDEPHLRPTRP